MKIVFHLQSTKKQLSSSDPSKQSSNPSHLHKSTSTLFTKKTVSFIKNVLISSKLDLTFAWCQCSFQNDRRRHPLFGCSLHQRDYREEWPLLTLETETNGDSGSTYESVLPRLGCWAYRALAALVSPVQNIFLHCTVYTTALLVPIAQQAWQAVVPHHLSHIMCLWSPYRNTILVSPVFAWFRSNFPPYISLKRKARVKEREGGSIVAVSMY